MTSKEILVQIYSTIATDPLILELLGLSLATPKQISSRISKTRQLANVADNLPRLAIYERKPSGQNSKVATHILVIDILVSLETQARTGLALDISTRLKSLLVKTKICMNFKFKACLEDLPTAYGWYKASVLFTYDKVETIISI